MKTYTLQLELQSPTLIGSGEGFGAIVGQGEVAGGFLELTRCQR